MSSVQTIQIASLSHSKVAIVPSKEQVTLKSMPNSAVLTPPPKKAKLLRRLIDFFHNFGSHQHQNHQNQQNHHPYPDMIMENGIFNNGKQVDDAQVPSLAQSPCINQSPSAAVSVEVTPMITYATPSSCTKHNNNNNSVVSTSHKQTLAHGRAHSHSKFYLRIFSKLSLSRHQEEHHAHSNGHRKHSGHSLASEDEHDDEHGNDDGISEAELDIVQERLSSVTCASDLSFRKKYKFFGNKVIGKGASGTVRLGCRLLFDSTEKTTLTSPSSPQSLLAIKEFRKRRKSETPIDYLKKLTAEFSIASRMNHPNVVHTIDIVHDGQKWYEIMEYCSQGDLFSFIQRGGLKDIVQIDCCLKQIVESVHYLHSQGVAHRDLKPENMLIDEFGIVKVTDFGVSDNIGVGESMRLSKGVCGSSPYIAPEEFGGGHYDARKADVWSLGIIYYAMVFHGIPWEIAAMKDSNYCHYLTCGPTSFEPFTRLPCGARGLLKKMLEPNPAKRIAIDEIFADEWFKQIKMVPLLDDSQ